MNKTTITKIGILVVASISLFVWGISYLKGKNIFKKEDTYYMIYSDVNGLSVSNPVLINGYKVGQVLKIEIIQDTVDYFKVSILVDSEYKIRQGSVAQVFSQDIMGTRAIRLLMSRSSDYHQNRDTLLSSIESGLVEQVNMEIAPLKKKVEGLISSFDSAIVIVREIFNEKTQENLRNTFASIRATIQNLESSTFTLDTLLSTEKSKLAKIFSNLESISSNLKNNNEKISTIINNFSNISDTLARANIAGTLLKADKALSQLNQTLNSINNGTGTVAQLLNNEQLYTNLENASYHMSRLMRDLHENPKRYLHFSVFDFGRTVYQKEEEGKNKKKKKDDESTLPADSLKK
jgi:phospholipid/cholesterol/gamma-HCH transport system substrate-binding protein